jgi:hypothetical protein
MSKETIPQHNAHVLEEERKGIADNLAEQDTIRRCDAQASAAAVKHEQKVEAKELKAEAKSNAKDLKDQTKANAEKLKF